MITRRIVLTLAILAAATSASPRGALAQTPAPGDTAKSGVQLSGYVTASYTYATQPDGRRITGRLYDRFHDEFELAAARLTILKPVATDKLDAGFQVDLLYGQNAPQIRSAGLSLGDHGDLPQAFITLNVPTGHDRYVQFKAGKRWTMMDVEYLDEILNPNYSHGYAYIYLSNFTDLGFSVEAKLSNTVDASVRVINGWDVVEDNNKGKSVQAHLGITPSDRVALAFLVAAGPEQTDNTSNNRYAGQFVGTFKPASTTTIYTQYDVGSEAGLGATGGSATWWGAGLWGVFDLSPKASLAVRGDYMDDHDGVRTSGVFGFSSAPARKLQSATATLNVKSWNHALVRPEIRVEHSSLDDFGAATKKPVQVTFGLAVSYIF
jgi:hypothetical protein